MKVNWNMNFAQPKNYQQSKIETALAAALLGAVGSTSNRRFILAGSAEPDKLHGRDPTNSSESKSARRKTIMDSNKG